MRWGLLLKIIIAIVASLVVTAVIGLYTSMRPTRITSTTTPSDFALTYESVDLYTSDGIRLAGWFVPCRNGQTDATIVVLHGYPADKGDILSRAVFLAGDFNLMLVDFRYFGGSGGSYTTAGANEVQDLAAVVRYLRDRGQAKIGVYGFSMGAAVALMGVKAEPDIMAVVAEASYADLYCMMAEQFGPFGPLGRPFAATEWLLAKLFLGLDVKDVSPAEAVIGTQKPILIIHSRADEVIPFENAETIEQTLTRDANAKFWYPETGGHGVPQNGFEKRVGEFFVRYLKSPQANVADGLYTSVGGEATITVRKIGDERLHLTGLATWHGAGEMVNTGDLDGEADLSNGTATYRKDECEAVLTFGPATLTVEDNLRCGGMNVTFAGEYVRL